MATMEMVLAENELTQAGVMLFEQIRGIREDMKTLTLELRSVSEYIIQFRTQNVHDRLTKLEEGRLKDIEGRMHRMENFQGRLVTIFATIQIIAAVVGWYLSWRH